MISEVAGQAAAFAPECSIHIICTIQPATLLLRVFCSLGSFMRIKALILIVLFTLAVMGCSVDPPPPLLGIAVDRHLQVIAVEPNSPGLKAGVQVGDVLLDLTWFAYSNNIRRDGHNIDRSPVPFTDRARIQQLMDYEYLLKLRVQRGSQIIEVVIQPTVPVWRKFDEPTPTPLWPPNDLF
jgi:hypothetical protein